MLFRQILSPRPSQYAYLIGCQRTGEALVIDPMRDVDRYFELAEAEGLRLVAAAETHIHADFLSGCRELLHRGLTVYLSDEGGPEWSYRWVADADHRVQRLRHGNRFRLGQIELEARHTPGHTPEHLSFLVTDRGAGAAEPMGLLAGDFVFVGDLGRPDLLESAAGEVGAMQPAAESLFRSVSDFLELPDYLQLWPGHGAGSACGKALGAVPGSTVGYERRFNPAIRAADGGSSAFVEAILSGQPEPPSYFGRMKRWNRDGAPLLGHLPQPPQRSPAELAALAGRLDAVLLDTRPGSDFLRGHLPGSLSAPLDKSFPTIAGSYVDPITPIHLLAREAEVAEAVRELVRVGLDRIEGWAPPELLAEEPLVSALQRIESIDFSQLRLRVGDSRTAILDVRRRSELASGAVPGAIQIAHTRLAAELDSVPDDRTVVVYCAVGERAQAAAALLARHGRHVVHVADRFSNWSNEPAG